MSGEGPVYRPASSGGLDQGTKRLAIIAGGIGVVLLVVVGGWSLGGHHSGARDSIGGVPVIEPDPGPIKIKPANPGGMQLSGAEPPPANDGHAAGPSLAPGPETPDPAALQAELDAARRASPPVTPATGTTGSPAAVASAPSAATAPSASSAGTAASAKPPALASATQPPVTTSPARAPVVAPPVAAPPAPTQAAVAPPVPAAPEPVAPATGGVAVQLAALDTAAAAQAQWERMSHAHPALFDGHAPLVLEAARDGKTFYRLRTGGFPTIAAASEFCQHVREAKLACTIATF